MPMACFPTLETLPGPGHYFSLLEESCARGDDPAGGIPTARLGKCRKNMPSDPVPLMGIPCIRGILAPDNTRLARRPLQGIPPQIDQRPEQDNPPPLEFLNSIGGDQGLAPAPTHSPLQEGFRSIIRMVTKSDPPKPPVARSRGEEVQPRHARIRFIHLKAARALPASGEENHPQIRRQFLDPARIRRRGPAAQRMVEMQHTQPWT